MSLTASPNAYEDSELAPGSYGDQRQREISRQLVRLVDVLYALVLVQGAIYYRSLFTLGDEFLHLERVLPVTLALVLVYFIAIQSFVDYHLASEDQPYRLLDPKQRIRRLDLWRFYLDIVIVGLYSFFLLKCHVLIADPAADLTPTFSALVAMFLLYLAWGALRWQTKPGSASNEEMPYKPGLLVLCWVLYLGLGAAYVLWADGWLANVLFLGIALLIMVIYRWKNWSQNRACKGEEAEEKKEPKAKAAAAPPPAS